MIDYRAFREHMISLVHEFEDNWRANGKTGPEHWPDELSIEDWHEQFIVWLGEQKI